jgi:hypothetical protein
VHVHAFLVDSPHSHMVAHPADRTPNGRRILGAALDASG